MQLSLHFTVIKTYEAFWKLLIAFLGNKSATTSQVIVLTRCRKPYECQSEIKFSNII